MSDINEAEKGRTGAREVDCVYECEREREQESWEGEEQETGSGLKEALGLSWPWRMGGDTDYTVLMGRKAGRGRDSGLG